MPKVSIIIPCYNLGQYLDEAVDSILAQSFQDSEIIIVNDGSTDDFTTELLSNYNKRKTKVINQENRGLSSARNSGIKASSGEYILCLDADDKLHQEFLEKTIPVLDEDLEHKYGFVMPWAQLFGNDNQLWITAEYDPYVLAMRNDMHCSALFRRECWDAVGGYREHMASGYEDWDFWISIVAAGYQWVTVKEPLFYYRKRTDSMIKKSDEKRLELFRQIIKNNEAYYRNNYEDILVTGLANFESKLKLIEIERLSRLEVTDKLVQCQIDHETETNKLHLKIVNLIDELDSVKSSLSWKITAPFRAILDTFRRGNR